MRFIEKFEVILLDQGRTFMYENDRFGPSVDYYPEYLDLGGERLTRPELSDVVGDLFDFLLALSRSPSRYDSFPTVQEGIYESGLDDRIHSDDVDRIADLFARHEIGTISEDHVGTILTLSQSHRLGIVSNVWGPSLHFEENLLKAGISQAFEHRIWSSDHGAIKPASVLFEKALDFFGVPPSKVLYVGDHPLRDIHAAKTLGCGAAWVCNDERTYPNHLHPPDRTIRHLLELTEPNKAHRSAEGG